MHSRTKDLARTATCWRDTEEDAPSRGIVHGLLAVAPFWILCIGLLGVALGWWSL